MKQNLWYYILTCSASYFSSAPLIIGAGSNLGRLFLQIRKVDLEARSLQPNIKAVLLAKLREYKSDLNNLKSEVKRISSSNLNQAARDDLLESGMADAQTVCYDLCRF